MLVCVPVTDEFSYFVLCQLFKYVTVCVIPDFFFSDAHHIRETYGEQMEASTTAAALG